MTKSLLTFLLTSILTTIGFGQAEKEEIEKTFHDYFQTIKLKDNAKTVDYLYPKIFQYFPKSKMVEILEKTYSDTTSIITMGNPSIKHISKTLEIDGIKYALVKYSYIMTMTILETGEASDNNEEEPNSSDFTFELLKGVYGEKNIEYDRKNRKFDITLNSEMYVIKDPAYEGLKFLEKKESTKPLLEMILPKKVLKKL